MKECICSVDENQVLHVLFSLHMLHTRSDLTNFNDHRFICSSHISNSNYTNASHHDLAGKVEYEPPRLHLL